MRAILEAHEEGRPVRMGGGLPICLRKYQDVLDKLPVLSSPIRGKPPVLYITALENSLGALLPKKMKPGRKTPSTTLAELW